MLLGGIISVSGLTYLLAPRIGEMGEEIDVAKEVGKMEDELNLVDIKRIAKRRGITVGNASKRELAGKIVEEKRKAGMRGRLPFY